MYVVMKKLKFIKGALEELNKVGFSEIHVAVQRAYHNMIEAQEIMHRHPDNEEYVNLSLIHI